MTLDYYKILGVDRNASDDEIKKQYRRLARKYHPDVSKLRNAEKRFKEINEAYDVLKNKEKKANYDQFGSADGNPWGGGGFTPPPGGRPGAGENFGNFGQGSFSDIFGKMFNQERAQRSQRSPFEEQFSRSQQSAKPNPQTVDVSVDLEDVYQGADKTFVLTMPGQPEPKRLKVKIPKGIKEGQKIRLSKQGSQGSDLFLKVNYKKHPLYTVDGSDVYLDLPITPWEAALGANISIPTLGGTVEMKIPAGSQGGKKMRLKGRGLSSKDNAALYVTMVIKIPPESDKKLIALYEKMAKLSDYNPRPHFPD